MAALFCGRDYLIYRGEREREGEREQMTFALSFSCNLGKHGKTSNLVETTSPLCVFSLVYL